jgi:hypothetical protein
MAARCQPSLEAGGACAGGGDVARMKRSSAATIAAASSGEGVGAIALFTCTVRNGYYVVVVAAVVGIACSWWLTPVMLAL